MNSVGLVAEMVFFASCSPALGPPQDPCVVGPWIASSTACAGQPWCTGSSQAAECAFADCVIDDVYDFRADGGFYDDTLVNSPSQQEFSRPVPASASSWTTASGDISFGDVQKEPYSCTSTRLLVGSGPFQAGFNKPAPAYTSGIDGADSSGQWTLVHY
jgi:hypothetical protein